MQGKELEGSKLNVDFSKGGSSGSGIKKNLPLVAVVAITKAMEPVYQFSLEIFHIKPQKKVYKIFFLSVVLLVELNYF